MGLRERYRRWRNGLLRSSEFQRLALAFPPTRHVAQGYARRLFDLCAGFAYSQVLTACVRLRLCERVAAGPLPLGALAAAVEIPAASLERLVHAATALELLELTNGRVALGPLGAVLLANPAVSALVEHHALLYADLADPVALLRGARHTHLGDYWSYTRQSARELTQEQGAKYSKLMSESQQLVAADVATAYPVRRHRRWLDIGGGDGTFLVALSAVAPQLRGALVDVPAVAALAKRRFAAAGLAERFTAIGGDALVEPLPQGFDAVSLVRVLHDHDDAGARALLRAAVAALAPGGTLLVVEPLASEERDDPIAEAYFGWYFTAMGQGRLRTRRELFGLLAEAGLERPHFHRNRQPLVVRVMAARQRDSKHTLTNRRVSVE